MKIMGGWRLVQNVVIKSNIGKIMDFSSLRNLEILLSVWNYGDAFICNIAIWSLNTRILFIRATLWY